MYYFFYYDSVYDSRNMRSVEWLIMSFVKYLNFNIHNMHNMIEQHNVFLYVVQSYNFKTCIGNRIILSYLLAHVHTFNLMYLFWISYLILIYIVMIWFLVSLFKKPKSCCLYNTVIENKRF